MVVSLWFQNHTAHRIRDIRFPTVVRGWLKDKVSTGSLLFHPDWEAKLSFDAIVPSQGNGILYPLFRGLYSAPEKQFAYR